MSISSVRTLLELIYNVSPDSPHCSHCGRLLLLVNKDGKTMLYCKRCADIAAESEIQRRTI